MKKNNLDTELLRARLKVKNFAAKKQLLENHPAAAKLLTSGVLAGSLLFSGVSTPSFVSYHPTPKTISITTPYHLQSSLKEMLSQILPKEIRTLNHEEEEKVSLALEKTLGLKAKASLEGNKLNDDYGRMGAEQHLARYPGDFVENMAPGLGGWGYVSDPEIEKYYVAVQTLYLPNWKTDTKKLSDWYRFRKVVVVNPKNGKTIVAAVADAGPSDWTGKKFGGSPEVMAYLGINYGMQNHPVVLFFLDDPQKQIPLGPVEYNVKTGDPSLINQS